MLYMKCLRKITFLWSRYPQIVLPMVNKAVKDFLQHKFMEWYSGQVLEKLAKEESKKIDFKLSTVKPLWLIELFDYLKTNNTIISNGFKAAGTYYNFLNKLWFIDQYYFISFSWFQSDFITYY